MGSNSSKTDNKCDCNNCIYNSFKTVTDKDGQTITLQSENHYIFEYYNNGFENNNILTDKILFIYDGQFIGYTKTHLKLGKTLITSYTPKFTGKNVDTNNNIEEKKMMMNEVSIQINDINKYYKIKINYTYSGGKTKKRNVKKSRKNKKKITSNL